MAAPSLLASGHSGWDNNNATASANVPCNDGDVLVVLAGRETVGGTALTVTGGSGFSWATASDSTASHCQTMAGTATVVGAQTVTIQSAGGSHHGFAWWRFAAGATVGTPVLTVDDSGAKTASVTTGQPNSAVCGLVADWNATGTSGTTYDTGTAGSATELVKQVDGNIDQAGSGSTYATWAWAHLDAGAAGGKTVGLTAPTSSTAATVLAVEVLGAGVTLVYARPSADVTTTGWSDQAGGTTNLFQKIDEAAADDADYVKATS